MSSSLTQALRALERLHQARDALDEARDERCRDLARQVDRLIVEVAAAAEDYR